MECPPHYSPDTGPSGPICLPTCPAEFYRKSQYDASYYLQFATSFIAMLTSLFVIIPYCCLRRKRVWPQTMPLTIFIIVFILALSFPVSGMVGGYSDIICKDKTHPADNTHPKCVVFALWRYICPLAAVILWLFICIHLFCNIERIRLPNIKYQIAFVYSVSFGVPVVLSVIAISLNRISGDPNSLSCFITASRNNGWWIDGYWFIPIGIIMTTGCTLISIIFFRTYWKQGGKALLELINSQKRLLGFLLIALVAILIIDFYRMYTRIIQSAIVEAITDWYLCLYIEFTKQTPNIDEVCRSLLDPLPSYAGMTIATYTVILAATIFPLIFIDKIILDWWARKFLTYSWTPEFLKYNPSDSEFTTSSSSSRPSSINHNSASEY